MAFAAKSLPLVGGLVLIPRFFFMTILGRMGRLEGL
jgi:hypothetical protein